MSSARSAPISRSAPTNTLPSSRRACPLPAASLTPQKISLPFIGCLPALYFYRQVGSTNIKTPLLNTKKGFPVFPPSAFHLFSSE